MYSVKISYFRLLMLLILLVWPPLLSLPATAHAKMVAVNRPTVNMRSGPGKNYRILWQLERGYPLKVIASRHSWYRVRDFEGDTGWVYAPLTAHKAHVVVKKESINVRSGPGTGYRIVAKARKGVVFRTMKSTKGWVKVRHKDGITGWVARHLVWGW